MSSMVKAATVVAVCVAAVPASGSPAATPQVDIRFEQGRTWRATVSARFSGQVDAVAMANYGAPQYPRGWAEFVRDVAADDCAGKPVTLIADAKAARWKLERPSPQLCLSYVIDFEFAEKPWPYGNEQAAKRVGDTLYTVSKALIIAPPAVGPTVVNLLAPPGYIISSAWDPDRQPGAFRVSGVDRLTSSSLVVSREPPVSVRVKDTEVLLHLLGADSRSQAEIGRVLAAVIPEHARVFGGTAPSRYLITLLPGEPDSEAFTDSTAITTPYRQTRETVADWGNELAHEFFHLWNGCALAASTDLQARSEMEWLSEGFTEYYANRSLLRTRLISPDTYWRMAELHLGNYFLFLNNPAFAGTSLTAAGANKGKYRLGVYDGGWAIAFVIDVELAAATNGAVDLDDVLRRLFDRYAPGKRSFGVAEFVAILSEVAPGRDWKAFASAHITGAEMPTLAATAATLGLELRVQPYDGRAHLFKLPAAGLRERKIRERYEAGRPRAVPRR
jgi:hypothetical protein